MRSPREKVYRDGSEGSGVIFLLQKGVEGGSLRRSSACISRGQNYVRSSVKFRAFYYNDRP